MHDARLEQLLAAYVALLPDEGVVVHAAAAELPDAILEARARRASREQPGTGAR
jgi:hypothetical protein